MKLVVPPPRTQVYISFLRRREDGRAKSSLPMWICRSPRESWIHTVLCRLSDPMCTKERPSGAK